VESDDDDEKLDKEEAFSKLNPLFDAIVKSFEEKQAAF